MSKKKVMEMTRFIRAFIKKFEKKYGHFVEITIGVDESGIANNKNSLKSIETFAILAMHHTHPELSHIKNFKYRCRKLSYMRYTQAFQYIAFNCGYTKVRIGSLINRNHATVINSVRQAENYLYWECPEFKEIYYPLLNKIEAYVGDISNVSKRQPITKSVFTSFGAAKKNISSIDQPVSRSKEIS